MKLLELIQFGIKNEFSDLIISVGKKPIFNIKGELIEVDNLPILNENIINNLLNECFNENEIEMLNQSQNKNGNLNIKGLCRLRFNYFKHNKGFGLVFRYIPNQVPDFDSLNLPQSIKKVTNFESGLVIIAGKTSQGKSTTLASLINMINKNEFKHIITVEDPIEFEFEQAKSIIHQREIGSDVKNYEDAIENCLRERVDIIYLSELKNQESILKALEASQTGHLVLATIHGTDCINAINRIASFFPAEKEKLILEQLASNLKGVIWQGLIKSKIDGKQYPINEIFFSN